MPLRQRLLRALNPQSLGVLRPCTGVRGPGQAEGHSGHVVLAHLGAMQGLLDHLQDVSSPRPQAGRLLAPTWKLVHCDSDNSCPVWAPGSLSPGPL